MAEDPHRRVPKHPDGHEIVHQETAARWLGLNRRAVQHWMRIGKLPVYQVSAHRRYVIWSAISDEVRERADEFRERRRRAQEDEA